MKKIIMIFLILSINSMVFAQTAKKSTVKKTTAKQKTVQKAAPQSSSDKKVYRYTKKQEFDFEAINVDADYGSGLGDIMVSSRAQDKFKNKLPYKKNFNKELRKSLERIR